MAGWSALATALAFLPAGVLVAIASTRMGPVLDRFGPPRMIAVAFACAGGANRVVTTDALTAYRPALELITGVAALGVVVALSGLSAPRRRDVVAEVDYDLPAEPGHHRVAAGAGARVEVRQDQLG